LINQGALPALYPRSTKGTENERFQNAQRLDGAQASQTIPQAELSFESVRHQLCGRSYRMVYINDAGVSGIAFALSSNIISGSEYVHDEHVRPVENRGSAVVPGAVACRMVGNAFR
jgi:hypothetical protein